MPLFLRVLSRHRVSRSRQQDCTVDHSGPVGFRFTIEDFNTDRLWLVGRLVVLLATGAWGIINVKDTIFPTVSFFCHCKITSLYGFCVPEFPY